ncbi:MAG: alpha/beta hydrolase, partial [Leptospiraceae bacterium]|nr:alpha/beta hydrolase [Leptospiraceae bacterium]
MKSKNFQIITFIVLGLLFQNISCCSTEIIKSNFKDEINKYTAEYDTSEKIKIHFSTNRKTSSEGAACSDKYYSIQFDPSPKFGTCEVNVPMMHDIGNLDYEPIKNDDETFKFVSHNSLNASSFLDAVKKNPYPEIIVFVHGFNVKFEEAVLRAAQIKYDLKFPGEVVLYTWPAG